MRVRAANLVPGLGQVVGGRVVELPAKVGRCRVDRRRRYCLRPARLPARRGPPLPEHPSGQDPADQAADVHLRADALLRYEHGELVREAERHAATLSRFRVTVASGELLGSSTERVVPELGSRRTDGS
jgi:hypothetical protein